MAAHPQGHIPLERGLPGTTAVKLSIIIPAFNEAATIKDVIDAVKALKIDKEIIVVDDGSTDGTREILNKTPDIKAVFHEKNAGKGAAIRTGLVYAAGDAVCIQDADLEYDPADIPSLLERLEKGGVDAVFGSRFLKENPNIYRRYLLGNKFITWLINLLFGTSYTDTYTGYKLIKKNVFDTLSVRSWRYEMEAEISIKLKKMGYKVVELPINYRPRTLKEGKKIGWPDALKGALTALRLRF
jgi:glycosyltransferase involved in cell wall biosynthesis